MSFLPTTMQREPQVNGGARTNGRPTTQLLVNHDGRKPLFSSTAAATTDGNDQGLDSRRPSLGRIGAGNTAGNNNNSPGSIRRTKSTAENPSTNRRGSNASVHSSGGGTRIPRPSSSLSFARRKPISLAEAMKLAEGEEDAAKELAITAMMDHQPVDGSPSPAPRPWRSRNASDESKMRQILGEDHLDSKGQSRHTPSHEPNPNGTPVGTRDAAAGSSSATDVDKGEATAKVNNTNGVLRNITNDWKGPVARSPALRSRLGAASTGGINGESDLPALVPGIEDIPLPSIEPLVPRTKQSPEKSFAWELDDDFTGGELQVSDSPRVRVGTRPFASRLLYDETGKINVDKLPRLSNPGAHNTKLDEIRSRELQASGSNLSLLDRPRQRPSNTKLDDIRAREDQVQHQIPIPSRHLDRLRNTKLDEIRQREADGISRRAFAAARLEEIKEQNSMARPKSPEDRRSLFNRGVPRLPSRSRITPGTDNLPGRPKPAFDTEAGTRVPDTPVTIFKRDPRRAGDDPASKTDTQADGEPNNEQHLSNNSGTQQRRADDRELLRRLARAASSSPAATEAKSQQLPTPPPGDSETQKPTKAATDKHETNLFPPRRTSDSSRRAAGGLIKDFERPKPSVGFVGLQRSRSTESTKSKRSSMQSETDPTDRIEAEMKLFAPADNQSERGSTRAPSPPSDSEEEKGEATPRPPKPDPLTMPTPKVIGAYVETPATIKVERKEEWKDTKPPPIVLEAKQPRKEEPEPIKAESPPAPILRERKTNLAWREKDQDTASDPGAADESDVGVTTSAAVKRPRAKSLPRRRPPLKNTAKPPSVKADLLELQRAYNLDDSTFDDLDEILSGRKPIAPDLEKLLPSRLSSEDFEVDLDFKTEPPPAATTVKREGKSKDSSEPEESEGDLTVIGRMSKTLQTGLLGIRSAKQGIERLEGHFSQVKPQSQSTPPTKATEIDLPKAHEHHSHQDPKQGCPYCSSTQSSPTAVTYLHLALPRLFHRKPKFRITLLGWLLLILSLWYQAETAMCSMYCRPSSCPASKAPCVWSFDDPTAFGTALPIKIDQWVTSGHGRQFLSYAYEEAYDWVVDVQDLALGRDPADVDVDTLSPEQKRRHRRRLRKKGLVKPARQPLPEEKAKWDAWHQTRLAKERARGAREMGFEVYGYGDGDGETIGGDQRVE